jgi:hypothetical protein
MSNSSLRIPALRTENQPVTITHLLLLSFVSLAAVVWGAVLVLGTEGIELEQYLVLLGFFGLASAIFIFFCIRQNHLGLFYFPVFLTILFFLRFGVAPLICFVDDRSLSPDFNGHSGFLLRALEYVIIGTLAFWMGCHLATRNAGGGPQSADRMSQESHAEYSTLAWAGVVYAVVFGIKLYLLHAHLYSYVGSWQAYYAHLGLLQVLQTTASIGGAAALVIVTIEKYFHPAKVPCRLLFWMIFISEVGWGFASGMKAFVLQPFILVAIVASLIERKFSKGWVAVALLGLIALYPLSNTYRRLAVGQRGLTSATAVVSTSLKAISQTQRSEAGAQDWLQNGWRMSVRRMDMLTSVGLVLWLGPKAPLLRGKERWWMLPYYPFIPRFIWHSKPILDKGRRFSIATGSTSSSSLAITYPGDLYADYGLPGVVLGMFLLGVVSQGLTNTVTGPLDKRRLFVYAAMFLTVTDIEIDAFSFWATVIKSFVMLSVIALVVYGPRLRAAREPSTRNRSAPKPCES